MKMGAKELKRRMREIKDNFFWGRYETGKQNADALAEYDKLQAEYRKRLIVVVR